jgi:2-polyprenyl-3-methyl-5-hydroxy-6-metoxy-1,4-benzoquinol methylase
LRRLLHDPRRILAGLIAPGATAIDFGCGPGFFTLPMADMVGPDGLVVAVDLQGAILDRVRLRAERAGLASRIRLQRCRTDTVGELPAAARHASGQRSPNDAVRALVGSVSGTTAV